MLTGSLAIQVAWQFNEQKPAALLAARAPSPPTIPVSAAVAAPVAPAAPSAASLLIPRRLDYLPDPAAPLPPGSVTAWTEPWRDAIIGEELCLILCRQASAPITIMRCSFSAFVCMVHMSCPAALPQHRIPIPCGVLFHLLQTGLIDKFQVEFEFHQ